MSDLLKTLGDFASFAEQAKNIQADQDSAAQQYLTQHVRVEAEKAGYSWTMRESIESVLEDYQARLPENQELGLCITSFGAAERIRVTGLESEHPYLIVIIGVDSHGREVRLLQHVSQVSLLLIPLDAPQLPARRIGFEHPKRDEEDAAEEPPVRAR